MKNQKDAIKDVLDICHDGEKGYELAASEIKNQELNTIFLRLSQQRKLFIEELKNDIRDLGLDTTDDGSTKGFFHRTWINIKSTFASRELKAILEEAKRGESEAVDVYDEALSSELPEFIKNRLRHQQQLISGCMEQLNEFEDSIAV